ncbi:SRPBCC family protein [Wenyingzhuangia sp. 2_MG-2023]|uniref:SRPBCC family protein n=1 Tax=Wenyingzhuangia sp. 2_MG-2023 TaxID=3062639 RepID=UPI0026E1590D|nr:SRPBCC family protein [Wenyingzhuangia sp. 2_MG-2023]MDO6737204.1 SRPBCC family protein [Wenyingzhuangia sp. 2_MG-2023]MDO6801718.1 SRPBCC family protein [Wenyingzhuangia sp. 1_MG-2023]
MAFYQLQKEQFINADIDTVWEFMSSPKNLKEITPKHMGFDITSNNKDEKMYQGMIVSYIVKPVLNIPTTWVTEITHVVEKKYFVDEQRIGPYKLWHHQHILEDLGDGVLMKDIVTYQPPMGFIGALANKLFIKKQLETIFSYRFKVVNDKFNL